MSSGFIPQGTRSPSTPLRGWEDLLLEHFCLIIEAETRKSTTVIMIIYQAKARQAFLQCILHFHND